MQGLKSRGSEYVLENNVEGGLGLQRVDIAHNSGVI